MNSIINMTLRWTVAATVVLGALMAPGHAQKTKAQLNTEITLDFPDQNVGAITPLLLRTVSSDIVNAVMPTAPVVTGNLACFDGITGLLKDCGTSPTTNPLIIGTTPITSGITTRVLFDNAGVLGEYTVSGTGNVAMTTSPVFTTPALGTPSSGILTNATGLPLSGHANQAAFTVVANATGSPAAPTAVSIPALTQKASPVAADKIMIADSAASDALKYATVSSLATASSVSTIAGNTGAFTLSTGITNSTNDIRLSLSNVSLQATPTAPTGTTSASVMMGLGSTCKLTPAYSTRVTVTFNGYASVNAVGTWNAIFKFGTGTAPTNAAAVSGTTVGATINGTSSASGFAIPLPITVIITGLTPATAYWFDLAFGTNAGTASITAISCSGHEF